MRIFSHGALGFRLALDYGLSEDFFQGDGVIVFQTVEFLPRLNGRR